MAMNRMFNHPELFPCGDRVKLPHVGADATQLKGGGFSVSDLRPASYFTRRQNLLRKDYLQRISSDLVFSEDVVRMHAAHTLPFDENSFHCTYDCSDIVQCEKKPFVGVVGTYNPRNTHHHLPCHVKKRSQHRLEPLRKRKLKPIISNIPEDKETTNFESKASPKSPTFLTEDPTAIESTAEEANAKQVQTKYSQKWDEHLLMHLSKNTARWVVSEQTAEGPQKDKLRRMLEDLYGAPSSGAMDTLIHDDVSISEMSSKETILTGTKGDSKTSTIHQTAEEATYTQDESEITENKSRSLAAFYKQPDAVRRQQRQIEKELAGSVNSTAREINVMRQQPKPPPTLKDVMNPGIGDKMYNTHNQFEQEWLSGAQQLLQPDRSHLLLDTGNLYQITRQEDCPHDPTVWCGGGTTKRPGTAKRGAKEATQRGHRGYKKWSQLPAPIQGDVSLTVREAGYDHESLGEPDPNEVQQYKQNQALLRLVDEWRTKWHLGNKWYDSSIEGLVRDMSDIHEHVRLQAIATVAKAATYRPPTESGVPIQSTFAQKALASVTQHKHLDDSKGVLPEELLECVVKALDDVSSRVRITAAIALYTLNRPDDKLKRKQFAPVAS